MKLENKHSFSNYHHIVLPTSTEATCPLNSTLILSENRESRIAGPKTLHTPQRVHHGSPSSFVEIAKPCDPNFQRAFFNKAPASYASFSLCSCSLLPLSLTSGAGDVVQLVFALAVPGLTGCAQLVREPKPRTGPDAGSPYHVISRRCPVWL